MNKTTGGESAGKHLEGSLGDSVQALKDKGSEAVDSIKVRVVEITDQAKTKGMDIYDQAAALIKAKPFQAVAIAFGVGYLAMRINTSKLTPLAVLGGLGYFGAKLLRG